MNTRNCWIAQLPVVPAITLALLPKCPMCLAAWLGVGASVGAGSIAAPVWGLPLSLALLSVALASLAWRATRTRDARPLLLGAVGAAVLLSARTWSAAPLWLFMGLGILIAASVWSSLPKQPQRGGIRVFQIQL